MNNLRHSSLHMIIMIFLHMCSLSQSKVRGGLCGHPTVTEGRGSLGVEETEVSTVKLFAVNPVSQVSL